MWPIEWIFHLLHLLYLMDLWCFIILRPHSSSILDHDLDPIRDHLPRELSTTNVKLIEDSFIAKRMNIAFVVQHYILSRRKLKPSMLLHELIHVYQYQQVGLCYIPRCLFAQYLHHGYEPGEWHDLQAIIQGRTRLNTLNYEQQATLIEKIYTSQINPCSDTVHTIERIDFRL